MYKSIFFLVICSTFGFGMKLPVPNKECEKIVACYYSSGAEMFPAPEDSLHIENIDVSLCTHMYYSYVGLRADASVRVLDPGYDINEFKRFNDLRKKKPDLKTLVTIGGSQIMSENYTKVVSDVNRRKKLVNSVVDFVKKYDFNGIDINWEYPAQGYGDQAGVLSDKPNFVLLLKALREEFDKEGLILSAAVGTSEASPNTSYDIKGISEYVHFINLMTYDFHGTSDENMKVGHNAPLYPSSNENAEERKLNIDYVVRYWISQGASPRKIILGVAFYGISYTLANPREIGRGAPFVQIGGMVPAYYEICPLAKDPRWKLLYDIEQQVPYIYRGDQIIAYDDVYSIRKKAEYVNKMNLGGVLMWTIDQDDFDGRCGEKFPLMKTLNRVLRDKC